MEGLNIEGIESQNQFQNSDLNAEGIEIQNQFQNSKYQGNGTTFLKTCFNGLNALTGMSLPLGKYALDIIW
jgi:hypothetical protein